MQSPFFLSFCFFPCFLLCQTFFHFPCGCAKHFFTLSLHSQLPCILSFLAFSASLHQEYMLLHTSACTIIGSLFNIAKRCATCMGWMREESGGFMPNS